MYNPVDIGILLSRIKRSIKPILAHWLRGTELGLGRAAKIKLYLRAVNNKEKCQKIVDSLPSSTKILLKILIETKCEISMASLLARALEEWDQVSIADIGNLHKYGIAFFEHEEQWPGRGKAWQASHFLGKLWLNEAFGKIRLEIVAPKSAKIEVQEYARKCESNNDLAGQLNHFLSMAGAGKIKVTQSREISLRSINRLKKHGITSGQSINSATKFLGFGEKSKILRLDSTGLVVPLKKFAKFRQMPQYEELKYYLKEIIDNEFNWNADRLSANFDYNIKGQIFKILSGIEGTKWLKISDLDCAIREKIKKLQESGQGPYGWQITNIEQIEKNHIENLLNEWFEKAGVVNINAKRAVQMSSFGEYMQSEKAEPSHDQSHQKLIMQPDYTAILTHSGPWDSLAGTMGLFGNRTGDDNAAIFHFSQNSIHSALEHGHKIDQLIELLETNSTYPVPTNILQTFREWGLIKADGKIHRDVYLFAFENQIERDHFAFENQKIGLQKIGQEYIMTSAKEEVVLHLMNVCHASAVDYTQPPVSGIDFATDGRIMCLTPHDLRVTSLRDAIAIKKGDDYFLNAKKMSQIKDPLATYDRIQKLPGRKISINSALNLMIQFGIIKEHTSYIYLENYAKIKKATKGYKWRLSISAKINNNLVVIKEEKMAEVLDIIISIDSEACLKTYKLRKIPIK